MPDGRLSPTVLPSARECQAELGRLRSLILGKEGFWKGTMQIRCQRRGFLVSAETGSARWTPTTGAPSDSDTKPATGSKRRLLVVDDNRDTAHSLAMMLPLTGHETRAAFDGLEGVQAAAGFRPVVVLLDIGLPKINGYEAARQIRQQAWGKGMVLMALTGWG